MTTPESPSLKSLILVPSVITLAVTLLRLIGELQNWSPVFFSRAAGGAGAIVGISWLPPIFGAYFAYKLARTGQAPGAGRVIGYAALAIAVVAGGIFGSMRLLRENRNAQFLVLIVVFVIGGAIAYQGWSTLGKTLFAYGLAARIPVALVMLVAIYGNWGTHYDVSPPNFTEMAPLAKWFFIGLLPQMFMWIPFTICLGALFGGLTLLFVGARRDAPVAPTPRVA